MKSYPNDPLINRKYNYLYKTTNKINGKIYMGVHRTDNLNDGYLGSGILLKRAIDKYGIENFSKDIIEFFDTYKDALNAEKKIVNEKFIERDDVYNCKEGGFGNCKWSSKQLKRLSIAAKKRWENIDYKIKMKEKCYDNPERNLKISKAVKTWIKNNKNKHKNRMLKINTNPEKIKKTAFTHTGMKRSEATKNNIKNGIIESMKKDPNKRLRRSGKGMIYIYNAETNVSKRINKDDHIPRGWVRGVGGKNRNSKWKI